MTGGGYTAGHHGGGFNNQYSSAQVALNATEVEEWRKQNNEKKQKEDEVRNNKTVRKHVGK